MFGPDYTAECPACSAIAGGFNDLEVHLANHDVTLSTVSLAPLAKLQAYKRRMGWTFPEHPHKAATLISTLMFGSLRNSSVREALNIIPSEKR